MYTKGNTLHSYKDSSEGNVELV